jgi:hypothetical protein
MFDGIKELPFLTLGWITVQQFAEHNIILSTASAVIASVALSRLRRGKASRRAV